MYSKFTKIKLTSIICIISLAVLGYYNSLANDFVYDDKSFVVENNHIKDLNANKLISYFTSPATSASDIRVTTDMYRPLTVLSYSIDYIFWKLNPFGYHLTSMILHILNGILVYLILSMIIKNNIIALFASLFFIIHPVQTEAVVWVSGRRDVLFTFFFLLAFFSILQICIV